VSGVGDLSKRDPKFTSRTAPSTGRSARSFIPRAGRLSGTKHHALEAFAPNYLVEPSQQANFDQLFGRVAPLIFDIGFGMGESTLALAAARPDANIVGVDVHVSGIAIVSDRLHLDGTTNVKLIAADAHEVLMWMCAPRTLSEVHIWFSDPWPKHGQVGRRLIQPDFLELVASRLVVGGRVRMATDWQPYADQMLRSISAVPQLNNEFASADGGWAPRDLVRPLTGYEQKGIRAGRAIRDLVAIAVT
jgi:tRNA (guanine-N7-)-methyltransferase